MRCNEKVPSNGYQVHFVNHLSLIFFFLITKLWSEKDRNINLESLKEIEKLNSYLGTFALPLIFRSSKKQGQEAQIKCLVSPNERTSI